MRCRLPSARSALSLLLGALLVSSCDWPDSPARSFEVARQGSYNAALSANGNLCIVGSILHGGSLWDVARAERLFDWNHRSGEASTFVASAFSPEADFALTADHQTLVLWDARSGAALTYWRAPNAVLAAALSPRGEFALLGLGDYSAVLFDAKRGGVQRSFLHQDRVQAVALSADGTLAVTGSEDRSARLWNVQTGEQLQRWEHREEVQTVAITADGSRVFSMAGYDRGVLWDAKTGAELATLPQPSLALQRGQLFSAAVFSVDGALLLTGSSDGQLQLWDGVNVHPLASWRLPKRDSFKPTSTGVVAVGFGADNTFYAVSTDGFVHQFAR